MKKTREQQVHEMNYLINFIGKYRVEHDLEAIYGEEYLINNLREEYEDITNQMDLEMGGI